MKDIPLMRKMMALFLLLILIPSLCFGFFTFSKGIGDYVQDVVDDAQDVLQTMKAGIEAQGAIVENNLALLSYDESLLAFLNSDWKSAGQRIVLQIYQVGERIDYSSLFLKDMGARITLYASFENFMESYYSIMDLSHIEGSADYQAFCAQGSAFAWVGMDWARPTDVGRYDLNNFRAFICFREVYANLSKTKGVLKCAIRPSALFALVDEWPGEDEVFVLRDGEWIYGDAVAVDAPLAGQTQKFTLQEGNFVFVGVPVDKLGIFLVMRINAATLYRQAYIVNGFLLLAVTMTGLLMFLLARYILSVIFRRLNQAGRLMQRVEQGDFSVRMPESGRDEIGQLICATNKLLECACKQVTELTQRERSERKAQILALQYQVNPHFLFNTLNWLQMALETSETVQDRERLSEAIALMGETFRYNLAGEPIVPLGAEVANLKRYAQLHRIRKPGCLELEVDVPAGHEQLPVMRFMFQPLLENAIKHGMNGRRHLRVKVSITCGGDMVTIQMENDGVGIPARELAVLNDSLRRAPDKAGIGLANTAARLRLLFGPDSTVWVESGTGGMTAVKIRFRRRSHLMEGETWKVHGVSDVCLDEGARDEFLDCR